MKYLGKFNNVEEARECAKENNGFVKKQTYKIGETFNNGVREKVTFWYVYPKKENKNDNGNTKSIQEV